MLIDTFSSMTNKKVKNGKTFQLLLSLLILNKHQAMNFKMDG